MSLKITPENCKDQELLAYARYQEELLEKHTIKVKELEKRILENKQKENRIKQANQKIAAEYDAQVRILYKKNEKNAKLHAEYNQLIQDYNASLEEMSKDLYDQFLVDFNAKNDELAQLMADVDALQKDIETMAAEVESQRIQVNSDIQSLIATEKQIVEAAEELDAERKKLEDIEITVRTLYQTLATYTQYHAKLVQLHNEQATGYEQVRSLFNAGTKDRGFLYDQRNLLLGARVAQEKGTVIYRKLTEHYRKLYDSLTSSEACQNQSK